ncbi:unnamed protein product [Prorocentrum cordatum]|uniref:Selenoprotein O n=1 Tax=Prorocentrum cordatum TaxID=2364126 RepID=A0ABN9VPK0_9DINO|nr:unnamed protein product [Polarella glacialis]
MADEVEWENGAAAVAKALLPHFSSDGGFFPYPKSMSCSGVNSTILAEDRRHRLLRRGFAAPSPPPTRRAGGSSGPLGLPPSPPAAAAPCRPGCPLLEGFPSQTHLPLASPCEPWPSLLPPVLLCSAAFAERALCRRPPGSTETGTAEP